MTLRVLIDRHLGRNCCLHLSVLFNRSRTKFRVGNVGGFPVCTHNCSCFELSPDPCPDIQLRGWRYSGRCHGAFKVSRMRQRSFGYGHGYGHFLWNSLPRIVCHHHWTWCNIQKSRVFINFFQFVQKMTISWFLSCLQVVLRRLTY